MKDNKKALTIVHSKSQIKKLDALQKKYNHLVIIAFKPDIAKILERKGVKFLNIGNYQRFESPINKKTIEWVKGWSNKKIINNKNFKELFAYENYSLWWSLEFLLFVGFPYFRQLFDIIIDIETIENIFKTEKPSKAVMIGDLNEIDKIICLFAKKYKVSADIIHPTAQMLLSNSIKRFKDTLRLTALLYLRRGRFILRKISWSLLKLTYQQRKQNKKPRILMFPTGRDEYYDSNDKKIKKGDCFQSVINEMDHANYELVSINNPFNFELGFLSIAEEMRDQKVRRVPYESYLTFSAYKKALRSFRKLKNEWAGIKDRKELKEIFYYNGVNIYCLIRKNMDFFISKYFFDLLVDYETIKNIILKEKPGIVCMFGEASAVGRMVINASRSNNIKMLGIQHGSYGYPFYYIHNKSEVQPKNKIIPPYCPLPDITALYGEHDVRLLTRHGNYKRSRLRVVGDPRLDRLYHITHDKTLNKKQICKELGLNPNKKIAVYISQPLPAKELEAMIKMACLAAKKTDGLQLVIKLHPREISDYTHKSIAKSAGIKDAVIIKNFDTYKILHICDAMLVGYSSTAIEANVLGKPVIIIDPQNQGYLKLYGTKALLSAKNEKELADAFGKLFYGRKTAEMIKRERDNYIHDQCYRFDGLANKRIAELIYSMIK